MSEQPPNPQLDIKPLEDFLATARAESKKRREDIRERAEAWAKEHWGEDPVCPMCRNDEWGVHEPVAMEPLGYPPFPDAAWVACPASCMRCGYTVFINLIIAGIIDTVEDEDAAIAEGEAGK